MLKFAQVMMMLSVFILFSACAGKAEVHGNGTATGGNVNVDVDTDATVNTK